VSSGLQLRDRACEERRSRAPDSDGHGPARREVVFSEEPAMATTEASPAAADAAQPAPETPTPKPTPTPTPASSQPAPAAPTAPSAAPVSVAGRGDGKRKRGRPRKYGPDGSLLRPLNATPISASVPDDAGGAQYTPAAAVGAVMKRGRGRPVGFVSRATPISVAVTAAAPTAAVVVSAPPPQAQLGPLGESSPLPSPPLLASLGRLTTRLILRNFPMISFNFRSEIGIWGQNGMVMTFFLVKETAVCRSIVGDRAPILGR
jgi:hypothetical protein